MKVVKFIGKVLVFVLLLGGAFIFGAGFGVFLMDDKSYGPRIRKILWAVRKPKEEREGGERIFKEETVIKGFKPEQ